MFKYGLILFFSLSQISWAQFNDDFMSKFKHKLDNSNKSKNKPFKYFNFFKKSKFPTDLSNFYKESQGSITQGYKNIAKKPSQLPPPKIRLNPDNLPDDYRLKRIEKRRFNGVIVKWAVIRDKRMRVIKETFINSNYAKIRKKFAHNIAKSPVQNQKNIHDGRRKPKPTSRKPGSEGRGSKSSGSIAE